MANVTWTTKIQIRNDTTANWTSRNPILLKGEIGIEWNGAVGKMKIGDGVTVWASLPYVSADVTVSGTNGKLIVNGTEITVYTHPATHTSTEITGLGALAGKSLVEETDLAAALAAKIHTHTNKTILDAISQGDIDTWNTPQESADWNSVSGPSQILNRPDFGALALFDKVAKDDLDEALTIEFNGKIDASTKGQADGVASLDSSGKVPAAQLPSYVDDILEYADFASFPATGEGGKMYVDLSNGQTYRWSGSSYTGISDTIALGETAGTAYEGNKGKANADAITALQSSKLATNGDGSNVTVGFTIAGTRAGISTGATLAITLGKIAKYIQDFGGLAFKDTISTSDIGAGQVTDDKLSTVNIAKVFLDGADTLILDGGNA